MKELEKIYRKRKKQVLPLALTFAGFFILFRIVVPQWTDIVDAQDLVSKKKESITSKQQNIQFLNSIPDAKIENDFNTVTTALPTQKDIILIYTELVDAAARANVVLGGFSVNLGGIYSTEKVREKTKESIIGIPIINILISVSGPTNSLKRFADELYQSIPLLEIVGVNMSESEARYDVNFFYKPISVRPQSATNATLESLTRQETERISQLNTWGGASQ